MLDTTGVYDYLKSKTESMAKDNYLSNGFVLGRKEYLDCFGLPYRYYNDNGIPDDAGGLEFHGNIVKNTGISGWVIGYPYDKKDAVFVSGKSVFIGFVDGDCWGHTITDSMTHLWWFNTDDYRQNYSDCDIYYWSKKPLKGVFLELLLLSGVPVEKLHHLNRLTRFECAVVPDDCFFRVSSKKLSFTKEYIDLVDRMVQSCKSRRVFKKIYLIRANDGRQYTSRRVSDILKKNGYVAVNLPDYPLADQICIINNADEIVAEESSASHVFIFCKSGTKVTILRKNNYINEYQAAINSMRLLDVHYVDCHLSAFTSNKLVTAGPFFIYANDEFCNYFNVKREQFPYKEFNKYLKRNLYFVTDAKSFLDVMKWDDNYLLLFAKELEWSREYYKNKFSWIFDIPFINTSIKNRIYTKVVKSCVRNLI